MSAISGTRTLHRLIYVSHQMIKPAALDETLGDIIGASIRNNRQVAMTGLLLAHDGYFLQALEGPAEAVMNTYRRILDDRRHDGSKVLGAGPAGTRAFGSWNMCARQLSPADTAIVDTLGRGARFDPEAMSGPAALRLLKAVRNIQDETQRAYD
ncbi:BLUF domain-containing protein [Phenylobacterium sp.]|uniref:BLUF domain-containing protein n=1 Tax=Phenylobacterium sp. TaxID=1871053 RepID=UPI0039837E14